MVVHASQSSITVIASYRPSLRLSVPSIDSSWLDGGFAAERRAGRGCRSTAASAGAQ